MSRRAVTLFTFAMLLLAGLTFVGAEVLSRFDDYEPRCLDSAPSNDVDSAEYQRCLRESDSRGFEPFGLGGFGAALVIAAGGFLALARRNLVQN